MKILFVCHRFPYPPNRGGKIRPFHMIQHLGKSHEVIVASLAHTENELKEGEPLKNYCQEVIAEVVPDRVRWTQAALALLSSTPSSVAYFYSSSLAGKIREACQRHKFDAIIVHCAFAAQYVRDIPCPFKMLDFGDVDSVKWLDYSEHRSFPLATGYRIEAQKLRRFEIETAGKFDLCTATTRGEVEEVRRLTPSSPTAVIPNGVDLNYFHFRPESPRKSSVIVFLGRMDYYPNIDGVQLFASAIFPRVRKIVPQAEFRIVGSNPSAPIQQLAKIPGITVTGHVADVRPHLLDAAVAVAPLRIARGTQNKILQFLAMGIPVVTTTQAAKGVEAEPGRDFLVADEPQAFADEVVRLLKDPGLRDNLADAGRRPLATAHSWPASMKILDRLLENRSTELEASAVSNLSHEPA